MKHLLVCLASFLALGTLHAQEPADYVNPFIGTTNFGTCNPGAVCPNGMMSVVPFNVMGSEDNKYDKDARWWSTPYDYTNSFFTGFAHVNLSGVGCPELGSLLLMPTTGKLDVDYRNYGSKYEKKMRLPDIILFHLLNTIFWQKQQLLLVQVYHALPSPKVKVTSF